jgi:hypothetical protein
MLCNVHLQDLNSLGQLHLACIQNGATGMGEAALEVVNYLGKKCMKALLTRCSLNEDASSTLNISQTFRKIDRQFLCFFGMVKSLFRDVLCSETLWTGVLTCTRCTSRRHRGKIVGHNATVGR